MNATNILHRLKGHNVTVKDGERIGVVSSFGRGAQIVTKSDRTRDIVVTANTGDIDLDNEVVIPSGANTAYFERNKMIFADHMYDLNQVAGKMRRLDKYPSETDHQSWRVRAHINDNPIGNTVRTIVEETGQIGVSIGFIAKDYGAPTEDERKRFKSADGSTPHSVVREWDWFELSFTALPCNVACQSMAMTEGKSADMLEAVDRLVTKGLIDRESASLLGMPITPKRKVHAVSAPAPRRSVVKVYEWGSVG
ncbi:MAG: hypothetical protein JJ916_04240 [Phycisphaerales bacterium]|nr:hypothetical protein [Phycisphaerales bacterium]